jgi:hypothetical protein
VSLEFGIGFSSQADVFAAGEEAAQQVVSHLAGRKPDLALVFSSIRFADPRMLKAVRSVIGGAPLLGCTDAGEIITAGPKRRSVTVIGFLLGNNTCITAIERHISTRARSAGEHLAEALLRQSPASPQCLLVFPDGLSVSGSEIVAGIEKKISRKIKLVGATAGDDFHFQKTFQFFNDEILSDSLPGVLLCGDFKVGVGVRHGWVPVGRPRQVTRSAGHVVYQIDHRPAVSIYEDFLGLKRQELMEDTLANVTLSYPLGTELGGQTEYLLRDAIRVGRSGSLICTGDVPQGSEVRLMIGGYESALEAAQQAACEAREQLGGTRLKGALVFCSVARQKMLGSEYQGEIDVIRDALGGAGVRFGGFYSYGELAPAASRRGRAKPTSPLFHNESVVVAAFG